MDTQKMLEGLRKRAQLLDQAIIAMERLALGGKKRRGRPPKWATELKAKGDSAK